MVNSGSFESDVDRNEKGEFTQPRRVAESPQSASSVHAVSGSLCETDFTTQTADSLPPASQAIEPTATKTEYKCSMSELLLRARKILTTQCNPADSASRANNDVYQVHETSIVSEGYPTDIEKSEETSAAVKEGDVGKCNFNKVLNKDEEIKRKVSVCCSVPLEKVQNILKTCRSSAGSGDSTSLQIRKQISKKDMCLYCDRTFATSSLKQKHVDRFHSLKYNRRLSARRHGAKHSVTACMFCDKLNNVECSLRQLFEHLVTEHAKKYFGCLECETRFSNFQILENHNISNHGAKSKPTLEQNTRDLIPKGKEEDLLENDSLDKLDNFLGSNLDNQDKSSKSKFQILKTVDDQVNNSRLTNQNSLNEGEKKNVCVKIKNRSKSKRLNENRRTAEEKRKQELPTLSVTLEPLKSLAPNENSFIKEKSKMNWAKELRSKKVSVVSTKMGIKQCLRITRQQSKTLANAKNSKRKLRTTKNDHANKAKINTKYLFQNHPYTTFDVSFRVKKITDHSIDNIKISSLTFDDVFDKAFFNRVKCNIQENLLNHIDGKLFKSVESENRISSFQKLNSLQIDEPSQNYGCKIAANVAAPITTPFLTDAHIGEEADSQVESSLKPSKKKGPNAIVNDEVHYKYFTRRKYQAVISENKQHRDLSKLDMWTQLIVKNRQQKIVCEQKTDKEILEYKKSDEYKIKMQVEELDRILDKRGPLEDLKEEAIRTVALEKLNGTAVDSDIESYFDVTIILNQLLSSVFTTEPSVDSTPEDVDNKCTNSNNRHSSSEISQVGEEMPTMLNLRRISYVPQENNSPKLPNSETDKTVMMELTGEWARSKIYVCAACGIKMPNTKSLIDHKNVFHEHVWCQHYEFVGNQGELYRHLSIPGLGKVGEIESSGSKMWRRSDARVCSKCNKQFNCLGDLHRHVLECGGDWSWMLARKKYKYRPYGSKPRKRRRGLLKFLHTFRERKGEQPREKGKVIKKFDGPRQKPSDADTIQRMLANLPAKRATRKIISMKDGLQRSVKKPAITKVNKNKSLKQKKMQANKATQKNKDPGKNAKKSRRLLRSNSNLIFENQMNLILPNYKKERNETKTDAKSTIRRHSVRNISRVLSNKLVKANTPQAKNKVTEEEKKSLKSSRSISQQLNLKANIITLNKNQNEDIIPTVVKNCEDKNIETEATNTEQKSIPTKKISKTSVEKKTITDLPLNSDHKKRKHIKKGKLPKNKTTKLNENESQIVQNYVVDSTCQNNKAECSSSQPVNKDNNKIKFRSAKGTFIKKSVNSQQGELQETVKQPVLDLVSKPLNFIKSIKKKKKINSIAHGVTVNEEANIPQPSKVEEVVPNDGKSRNKKTKYTFSLRKSKLQQEHKNLESNPSGWRKNNMRSKTMRVVHNINPALKKIKRIKKTITKIIQVDGSSQSRPSTRSKRLKNELPHPEFLGVANNKSSELTTSEEVSPLLNLNEVIKIIPEDIVDADNGLTFPDSSNLPLSINLTTAANLSGNLSESNTGSTVDTSSSTKIDSTENVPKCAVSKNISENSSDQYSLKTVNTTSDTNNISLPTNATVKKKINKKQRGLNDCIAMLTNKLQDKNPVQLNCQNTEQNVLGPIIKELPNTFASLHYTSLTNKSEEKSNNSEQNVDKIDLIDLSISRPYSDGENCKNNKENFKLKPSILSKAYGNYKETSVITSSVLEQSDEHVGDQDNCKYSTNEMEIFTLIDKCISPLCHDIKYIDKESEDIPLAELKSFHTSNEDSSKTVKELELQNHENQSNTLQLIEQLLPPKVFSGNTKIQNIVQDTTTTTCKIVSDSTTLHQTNTDIGVFHGFNPDCDIDRIPKHQTQNFENIHLKCTKRNKKHKKKNLRTKVQNSRKSLRNRHGNKEELHETIRNGARTDLANNITEVNESELVKSGFAATKYIDNDQTAVLSTSEEFSNSGKENVVINEEIKPSKHRKTKQNKDTSKKKNKKVHETPVNNKNVGDDMAKETKLDVNNTIENTTPTSYASEFVDSEDDLPLAEFVKKAFYSKTDIRPQVEDPSPSGLCEKLLSFTDTIQNDETIILDENDISTVNLNANEEICSQSNLVTSSDSNILSTASEEATVLTEANLSAEIQLHEITQSRSVKVTAKLQSRKQTRKKSLKLTNKRNKEKKKHTSSKRKNVLADTASSNKLFSEHSIPIDSSTENRIHLKISCNNHDNNSYSKVTLRSLNNSDTATSEAFPSVFNDELRSGINSEMFNSEEPENLGNTEENYAGEVDKTNSDMFMNLENEMLHNFKNIENSSNSALNEKEAEHSIQNSPIMESLIPQSTHNSIVVENKIAQDENVENLEPSLEKEPSKPLVELYDTNSSVSTISAKSKTRLRLKTVFNNKKSANVKKKIKPQDTILNNIFCDICNKTFTRSENLLKHKRTLTHIAKLSELEALQAAEKLKQDKIMEENTKQSSAVEECLEDSVKDSLNTESLLDAMNVNVPTSEYEVKYPKNTEISTFGLAASKDSLKLVDIISDVLSKPIEDDFIKPNSFSGLILPSDHETKRYKSLGERKSFDSDKLQLLPNPRSPTHNLDLDQKFVSSKLSNTADIIVEKQISLLENMIEDNFKSSDRIFSPSDIPANEEYSNQSSSSEFSLLSTSKQEEGNDITFTHNTNIINNLIKPALDEDNLIHSMQYEEISEDSSSSHFQVEEQKSRKALNRDEELFLECCSLLKSSSDISELCKKPVKSAQFLNNFGLKPLDEFEWLEQKQLPTKKNADFEYISNNFISDDSHMNVSGSDNFYNDLSYSNSNTSNGNLNLKILLDRNVGDQLFSQPPPIFEDISTESESSSAKSLGNCFKTLSSAVVLNEEDVVYDKIEVNNQLSPSVESAQIPEEHDNSSPNENEKTETTSLKFDDEKSKTEKDKPCMNIKDSQDIIFSVPKTTQTSITEYAVPSKIKKNQNKKMLTKGAMKVFEGLKVSIPKDGIDMKEVLSCSPTSKRLQLEAEEENININKKSGGKKGTKQNLAISKIVNSSESIKKIGNSLGLKISKRKYLPNDKGLFKTKTKGMTENEHKSHDIYDFEETQDNMDTFTSSSNSLPIYRSFRNKFSDKSNEIGKSVSANKKKSCLEYLDDETKTDDESLLFDDLINNRCVSDKEKPFTDPPTMEPPSKKIDMCKSITKKKCMIMGRIFKNAVKSKIVDEIKNIPSIENCKIVEDFVLNCQHNIQPESEVDKEHKLSQDEMNTLFDNLLNEEKSDEKNVRNDEITESQPNTFLVNKNGDHKSKHKLNRCKKKHKANSSDFSDEEFSIKKFPKRTISKKSSKNNDCVINLEQELKECIGVASRKSQRKCTSGKQNVLVEYWSSDESNFETDYAVASTNCLQNIAPKPVESPPPIISFNQHQGNVSKSNIPLENESRESELCESSHDTVIYTSIDSGSTKKTKEVGNKLSHKLVNPHNGNKLPKTNKNGDTSSSSFEIFDSQTIASCRRKRSAVDTLYYWSSSSEDELQDIIEVKPLREEYDDEDRPLQHGWIVGDSPKKLVTMLAQAKGKKLDVECVKKNKKKRTGV